MTSPARPRCAPGQLDFSFRRCHASVQKQGLGGSETASSALVTVRPGEGGAGSPGFADFPSLPRAGGQRMARGA